MNEVNWTKNDTIVFSDVHMGRIDNKAEKLYAFLCLVLKNPPRRVIVAGDLFELWSTNYKKIGKYEYKVIRKIIELSENDIKVVYIPGNHDRAFNAFRKIAIGKIKIQSEYIIKNDKKKFIVIHGDEFDAFTRNHIILSLIIDRFYVFLIKISSFFKTIIGFNISVYDKKKSSSYKKIVQKIKKAALVYADSRKLDGIIIGHTHWPEVFTNIDNIIYANAGDWLENCSYLVVDGDIKLKYFK